MLASKLIFADANYQKPKVWIAAMNPISEDLSVLAGVVQETSTRAYSKKVWI
jgi:hypothetical protein